MFQNYETVYISEILEGNFFSAGWWPTKPVSVLDKVKKFFGFFPMYKFYATGDISPDLKQRIPKGYYILATSTEEGIFVNDIVNAHTGKYLDYFRTEYVGQPENPEPMMPVLCAQMQLERLPELYSGPYDALLANKLRTESKYGIIIKPYIEKIFNGKRKVQSITTIGNQYVSSN
jgi:hypothetical protein